MRMDWDKFVKDCLADEKDNESVTKYINKLYNSMRCFYFLSRYSCVAGQIAEIRVRVSSANEFPCFIVNKKDDKSVSKHLFKGLITQNDKEEFKPPFELSKNKVSSRDIKVSTNIYECQYDVNPMLSRAEPLFGYTIQRQNQIRGTKSDWNKILIGEDMTGKELYASLDSDIPLQKYFIHNIYAGSRAGKGVMTMNILVSALAAGRPIFYLDRKPDMAGMLYNLSGGSQFIVNGGLYTEGFSTCKAFSEEGDALYYWRKNSVPWLKANPKFVELFGASSYENTVLADFVYFRAFMFCFGLFALRSKLYGANRGLYDDVFNGESGLVLVVDELTGYQNSIKNLLGVSTSKFIKKGINMPKMEELNNKLEDLQDELRIAQMRVDEAIEKEKPQSVIETERKKVKNIQREINNLFDEQAIYVATFYAKMSANAVFIGDEKFAGFEGKEFLYSDIFVLGQELNAKYVTSSTGGFHSEVFFEKNRSSPTISKNAEGGDIVRSILEEFGSEDWFMGRNKEGTALSKYAGKDKFPEIKRATDGEGNWAYIGARTHDQACGIKEADFSDAVLFKPYLVLNEHYELSSEEYDNADKADAEEKKRKEELKKQGIKVEDDLDGEEKKQSAVPFSFVRQCRKRVNDTAGTDLWSQIRVKHLNAVAKSKYTPDNPMWNCLDEGIGFKGLVRDTLATVDPSILNGCDIDKLIQDVLSKSSQIANYVAQAMGFECWQDLIYDITPRGLFSWADMQNAVMHPDIYTYDNRFPLYAKLDKLDLVSRNTGGNKYKKTSTNRGSQSPVGVQPTNRGSQSSEATAPTNKINQSPEIPANKETQNNASLQYVRMPDEQLMKLAEMIVNAVINTVGKRFSNQEIQHLTQLAFTELRKAGF